MLEALRRVVQEVSTAPDLTAALEVTVDRVRSIMTTEVCSVYLLDDKQNLSLIHISEPTRPY